MSETVHYSGTLHAVDKLENETLEEQCKRLLNNQELKFCCDLYTEMLLEENYQKYIIHKNILYSVYKQNIDLDEDIFNASKDENGVINFEVKYYSGGCGFYEAIEYALNNMK